MTDDSQRTTVVKGVLLDDREQRALAWLLGATDNGKIISGAEPINIDRLADIRRRLGRKRNATRC